MFWWMEKFPFFEDSLSFAFSFKCWSFSSSTLAFWRFVFTTSLDLGWPKKIRHCFTTHVAWICCWSERVKDSISTHVREIWLKALFTLMPKVSIERFKRKWVKRASTDWQKRSKEINFMRIKTSLLCKKVGEGGEGGWHGRSYPHILAHEHYLWRRKNFIPGNDR